MTVRELVAIDVIRGTVRSGVLASLTEKKWKRRSRWLG